MLLSAPPVPVLLLGGGAGSGKTTVANALAIALPGTRVLHLDACFHDNPDRAPVVPAIKGHGFVINYSDPRSLDWDRVQDAIDAPVDRLLVIEGTFALLPALQALGRWSFYLDTPADLRLARKILRKISDGADPEISLCGYLAHGRTAHLQHVAPIQNLADVTLDGSHPTADLVQQMVREVSTVLEPAAKA